MSRYGGRHSSADLTYAEEPNRWDRERFERFRSRGPEERDTIRISERDSPRRTEIRVEERETRRPPKSVYDERDFEFMGEERYGPPARIPRPRRSDRELFGEEDPRDIAERQLAPYRRKSIIEREIDIDRFERPRPMLARRQSSLDSYDRRPLRREREEHRLPPNVPIPLPLARRRSPSRRSAYDDFEEIHYRDYSPHDYRDVEITRERSHVRKRDRARSDLRSVSARSSSNSTESFEEISRHSSPSPEKKVGKKGKTRMPKRLVKKEAIIQLKYPYEEEDDFIIVHRALEKEQIDEVIRISESFKGPKTTTYRFEETLEEVAAPPPPPVPQAPPAEEHYEALRTEWINPPSVRAPSVRAPSPARSSKSNRTRRSSPARTVRAPSPIYIHQPAPPPVRETVYIQQPAPPPPPQQPMTIVLPERHRHNDRDIQAEIRALEAEQRALRHERDDRTLVVRRPDDYEVVEYRERRPDRELVQYERPKSPKREVIRVEKDRKEKRPNPKLIAAMMATLT